MKFTIATILASATLVMHSGAALLNNIEVSLTST